MAREGLIERRPNPADQRSLVVALTDRGVRRLRDAQVTHHAVVRGRFRSNLDARKLAAFAELWEAAVPGSVPSATWPVPAEPDQL